jgi:hypothetical protein
MKTAFATLAAAAALVAVAAPAAAQPYSPQNHDRPWSEDRHTDRGAYNINERQARLDQRIDSGLRRGDLTRREAFRLRAEFRDIARLEARYRTNGLSRWERSDLDRRFDHLDAQIRFERHDDNDHRDHTRRY